MQPISKDPAVGTVVEKGEDKDGKYHGNKQSYFNV